MPDTILLIVGAVIGTAMLLGVALCAGFWAGVQATARGHVGLNDELASLRLERERWLTELGALHSSVETSHEQSEVVGLMARSAGASISPDLVAAINRMLRTTRSLAQELQELQMSHPPLETVRSEAASRECPRAAGPPAPPSYPLVIVDDADGIDPALTKHEMWEVTGQHCVADSRDELEARRYYYDCIQRLAPCGEDEVLPASSQFKTVRCHDISVSGVSFLWPEMPEFSRAIISVGPPAAPIYMAIEVTQYKSVFKHGSVCFLVGGRFVSRLGRSAERASEREAMLCS